jgi:hypothetical protein
MDVRPDTGADIAESARSGIGPRWLMGPGRHAGKILVNPLVARTIAGRIGPYAVVGMSGAGRVVPMRRQCGRR